MSQPFSLIEVKSCVSCGNNIEDSTFLFQKGSARYYQCNKCSLVYQNPQPVFEFTEEIYDGEHYHERYIKSEYIYFPTSKIYLKEINKSLNKISFKKNNARLLDVGCGIGYFLTLAKNDGFNVQGADISKWAAQYAKQKFNVDVIAGNFLEMSLNENGYDIITLWQTIEHLPNPNEFLKKIHMLLKVGGVVCIATPDVNSWIAKFYKRLWNCYMPNEHIALFNFKSMETILRNNNFSTITIKRIHEREFFYEQIEYLKLFFIRLIKNIVLKTKIFKPLFPKTLMRKWEAQTDLEIPLPSIAYSVFAIGQKK
jgi:2-polyprenyl-3-methyl-5-hydroxy-6-metoxy-1,4-benzoquinol methylase